MLDVNSCFSSTGHLDNLCLNLWLVICAAMLYLPYLPLCLFAFVFVHYAAVFPSGCIQHKIFFL